MAVEKFEQEIGYKITGTEATKKQAKEILKYLGLTYSQAINVFNNMIVCHKGLPFEIKIPNDETLAAMSEAELLKGDFVSIDDFVKQPL